MIGTLDPMNPQFIYDAKRKCGIGKATDKEGGQWVIEFRSRDDGDRMGVVVFAPGGQQTELTVGEEDFAFSDNTVSIRGVSMRAFMHPVYLKKMRGFTRGNIPTPDIPGSTLP